MLMAACRLGSCRADDYRVTITERADRGGGTLIELDVISLEWERLLDGTSTAKVEVPASCCGKLADVRSWRHELHISRQDEEVWVGPIMVPSNCRSGNTIVAQDMTQWLARRVIHSDHTWTTIGSVAAAAELITDGLSPDDPDVLTYLTQFGTGVVGGREYLANSKYVLDALNDLAQGSLDYTTVGRRIILMPSGYELGKTVILTCEHFNEDVCTTEDGYAAATKAIVTGADGSGIVGTSGGTDSYFGLVEVLISDDQLTSSSTAADQARGVVNGSNPPPLLVQPPDGSSLAPSAPVCLSDLVPGVTVPVSMDCTCRTATQDMRLKQLKVTVDADGERVAPLLTPIGFDGIS